MTGTPAKNRSRRTRLEAPLYRYPPKCLGTDPVKRQGAEHSGIDRPSISSKPRHDCRGVFDFHAAFSNAFNSRQGRRRPDKESLNSGAHSLIVPSTNRPGSAAVTSGEYG